MNIEKSELQPEQVMNAIEQLDSFIEDVMNQVREREREQLNGVFLRFCLRYGKMVDMAKVSAVQNGKNVTDYYYDFGGTEQYFLMKATFIVGSQGPQLNIDFNSQLVFNNEL